MPFVSSRAADITHAGFGGRIGAELPLCRAALDAQALVDEEKWGRESKKCERVPATDEKNAKKKNECQRDGPAEGGIAAGGEAHA